MLIKKALIWIGAIIGSVVVISMIVMGPSLKDFLTFKVLDQSNENIYYFSGYGGNSGLIVGEHSAVLIDTKLGKGSKKLEEFTKDKIGGKKLFVINTHFHSDHISGNHLYKEAEIISGNYGEEYWISLNKEESLPSKWIDDEIVLDLGEIKVKIIPIGINHTTNDLFIYIPSEKVLFTGDVYTHRSHPVMKKDSKPDIIKWEKTLRSYHKGDMEIDLIIPGHGKLAVKEDLVSIADYFDDFKKMPKRELRKKYRKWDKLPFLATVNQSWEFIRNGTSKP